MNSSVVIWAISDGKPGHVNQMRGLIAALTQRLPVQDHFIDAPPRRASLCHWLLGRFPAGNDLPDPHLVLGAGHRSHPAMLAAKRARGGRAIVIMTPSLPLRWFDLVIAPHHDQVRSAEHVLLTRGAMNDITTEGEHRSDVGLILFGGPSDHHGWDEADVCARVRRIAEADRQCHWRITTSRRTPDSTVTALQAMDEPNVDLTPFDQTTPTWVRDRLAESGRVWVTEDSVSMVYEAVSSGAAVGLLPVPGRGENRVIRGLDSLVSDGMVTRFDAWAAGRILTPPPEPLREADRVADAIIERGWCGCDTMPR